MPDFTECRPDGTVIRRVASTDPTDAVRGTVSDALLAAIANNRAYVALASPSNAQTTAAVKALARQNVWLTRLLLAQLDATD